MSTELAFQSTDSAEFFALKPEVREEVEMWLGAMDRISKADLVGIAQKIEAQRLGVKPSCVRCNWGLWKKSKGDWHVFIDRRKARRIDPLDPRSLPLLFKEDWRARTEKHALSCVTAYEELLNDWKHGKPIPGYKFSPPRAKGMIHPRGWSYENLMKLVPSKFELKAMREGLGKAISLHGPKVFTSRVGLHFFSHLAFDDVGVDDFCHVWTGRTGQVCRSNEMGCLEVLTSDRFAWGSVPGIKRKDGTRISIREAHTRFLLARVLYDFGYSPLGTELVLEHGTGTIRDRFLDLLVKHTGGLITTRKSGFTGREQAVAGSFLGSGGGNPRHKPWLESFHHLMHNRSDALPGQTGPSVPRRPEQLDGMLDYSSSLLEVASQLTEWQRKKLQLPTLEYYSEYIPMRDAIYRAISMNPRRNLEGWAKCGFVSNRYRLNPELDQWIPEETFLLLDDITQNVIRQLVKKEPETYQQPHQLSTGQAFEFCRQRQGLIKPPIALIAELLREDLCREGEQVKDCYFSFEDLEIDQEQIRFHSRLTMPNGQEKELPDREKFDVTVNPFDPTRLWVYDEKKIFIGTCPRDFTPSMANHEGVQEALRYRAKRLQDIKAPLQRRHRQQAAAAAKRDEHNIEVLSPVTDRRLSAAADRAITTLASKAQPRKNYDRTDDDTY